MDARHGTVTHRAAKMFMIDRPYLTGDTCKIFDGCYSSKFLRSSARRVLSLEARGIHIAMCLRVLRDALVSRATASERAMVRATRGTK